MSVPKYRAEINIADERSNVSAHGYGETREEALADAAREAGLTSEIATRKSPATPERGVDLDKAAQQARAERSSRAVEILTRSFDDLLPVAPARRAAQNVVAELDGADLFTPTIVVTRQAGRYWLPSRDRLIELLGHVAAEIQAPEFVADAILEELNK